MGNRREVDHKVAVTARTQTAVDHAVDIVEEAEDVVEVAAHEIA